jgi:hypothetical protein
MSRTLLARLSTAVICLACPYVAYTQGNLPPTLTIEKAKDNLYGIVAYLEVGHLGPAQARGVEQHQPGAVEQVGRRFDAGCWRSACPV